MGSPAWALLYTKGYGKSNNNKRTKRRGYLAYYSRRAIEAYRRLTGGGTVERD